LRQLLAVFDAFDKVYQQVFASDQSFRQTIEVLSEDAVRLPGLSDDG
jgi:hypothetical protein